MLKKKLAECLEDLVCRNCVNSDEGADDGFIACCKDQDSLAGFIEFKDDSFCGEGFWSLEVNEGDKMVRYSCTLPEATTILLNGGDSPWEVPA